MTPIREVDDHVIGRPGPVTVEIQKAYLDTVHGRSDRWAQWLEYAPARQAASVKQEVGRVPLSGPYVDERDEELVLEVLRSGRLSLGPTIDRFEEAFAAKSARRTRRPSRPAPRDCICSASLPASGRATR